SITFLIMLFIYTDTGVLLVEVFFVFSLVKYITSPEISLNLRFAISLKFIPLLAYEKNQKAFALACSFFTGTASNRILSCSLDSALLVPFGAGMVYFLLPNG